MKEGGGREWWENERGGGSVRGWGESVRGWGGSVRGEGG